MIFFSPFRKEVKRPGLCNNKFRVHDYFSLSPFLDLLLLVLGLDEKRADGKNPPSILSPKGRKSSSAFLNSGHGVGNGLFTVNIKK